MSDRTFPVNLVVRMEVKARNAAAARNRAAEIATRQGMRVVSAELAQAEERPPQRRRRDVR